MAQEEQPQVATAQGTGGAAIAQHTGLGAQWGIEESLEATHGWLRQDKGGSEAGPKGLEGR